MFFATVVSGLFFPADMPDWLRQLQTFGIFAAGYLARPIGGIVIAHFGDKLGRKRMFSLSIFLMAVPTLVIGLLPTYASIGVAAPLLLLAMRVLQGAAIGGEMPGAWVFVAEHVPKNRYGLGVGTLTAGITGGILLGSLVAIAINRTYTPAEVQGFAWRIPFILGGVFGLVSVYLRRFLHETPVFQELAARRAVARELPLKTIFRDHKGAMLLVALMTWVLSTAVVVVVLITPSYLQKVFHLPATLALEANAVATLTLTIGCVVMGWATDRFGTRAVMLAGWGGLFLTSYLFYLGLPGTPETLVRNYALVGFFRGLDRAAADRGRARLPAGRALLGPFVLLQHGLCGVRRHHAGAADGVDAARPDGARALRGGHGAAGLRAGLRTAGLARLAACARAGLNGPDEGGRRRFRAQALPQCRA